MRTYAVEIAGESVRVQRHRDPFLAQEPVVVALAFLVLLLQFGRALDVPARHHLDQFDALFPKVVARAIQSVKQGMDGIEIRSEPCVEMAQVLTPDLGLQLVENVVQQRVGDLFVHVDLCGAVRRIEGGLGAGRERQGRMIG
jgi:hypothetical protein